MRFGVAVHVGGGLVSTEVVNLQNLATRSCIAVIGFLGNQIFEKQNLAQSVISNLRFSNSFPLL
jgi:hypothetical protein